MIEGWTSLQNMCDSQASTTAPPRQTGSESEQTLERKVDRSDVSNPSASQTSTNLGDEAVTGGKVSSLDRALTSDEESFPLDPNPAASAESDTAKETTEDPSPSPEKSESSGLESDSEADTKKKPGIQSTGESAEDQLDPLQDRQPDDSVPQLDIPLIDPDQNECQAPDTPTFIQNGDASNSPKDDAPSCGSSVPTSLTLEEITVNEERVSPTGSDTEQDSAEPSTTNAKQGSRSRQTKRPRVGSSRTPARRRLAHTGPKRRRATSRTRRVGLCAVPPPINSTSNANSLWFTIIMSSSIL